MRKKTASVLSYLATPGALALAAMLLYSLSAMGGGNNVVTKVQELNVQEMVQTICQVPIFGIGDPQRNDWNPTCLATNTVLQVQGADNFGSVITGIDAIDNGPSTTIAAGSNGQSLPQATINVVSTAPDAANGNIFVNYLGNYLIYVTTGAGQQTVVCTGVTSTSFTGCTGGAGVMTTGNSVLGGLPVGTMRKICNMHGTVDAGAVLWSLADTHSQPNNQIFADTNTNTTFEDWLRTDTGTCVDFIYGSPNTADPTFRRWIAHTTSTGIYHSMVQNLELWPQAVPAAITGTLNNWNPPACSGILGPNNGSCQNGGSALFEDYSVVRISTVDGTGATITGMVGPGGNQGKGEGQYKILMNLGPGPLTITNSDPGSLAANQFQLPNATAITILPSESRMFFTNGSAWSLWGTALSYSGMTGNQLLKSTGINSFGVTAIIDNGTGTTIGAVGIQDSSTQNTQTFVSIVPNGTGLTSNAGNDLAVVDNRTFNTTGGAISVAGIASTLGATRSAGASNLTQVAATFQAAGAQVNYSIQTNGGDEYHGLGAAMNNFYVNMAAGHYLDTSAGGKIETTLFVGGGDFNGTVHQEACPASVLPTANHGTLSADSSNCIGEITAIGANTSVTLTFNGAFGTTSHCYVTVEGATPAVITVSTVSASAPVFSCFDMAGVALNCPPFAYHCWGH